MAKGMLENNIGHQVRVVTDPPSFNLRPRCHISVKHKLTTRPDFTSGWDISSRCFGQVKSK